MLDNQECLDSSDDSLNSNSPNSCNRAEDIQEVLAIGIGQQRLHTRHMERR